MDYIVVENQLPTRYIDSFLRTHMLVFQSHFKLQKLEQKKRLLVILAIDNEEVAGFKLGYEHPDGVFYSWLGGVHPAYQRRGIAAACMQLQHDWCRAQGYTRVRTYGRNEKRAMLLVNIKAGFDIIETFVDAKGRHKIVFEKNIGE